MKRQTVNSKKSYDFNKKQVESLLQGYESFRQEQEKKLNLQEINELQYNAAVSDYEDRLFYYEFAAWEYELWQLLQEFKVVRNDFTTFDKVGHYMEVINSAPPKRKFNFDTVEAVAKHQKEIAEMSYRMVVEKSKQAPVHLSSKKNFPILPGA